MNQEAIAETLSDRAEPGHPVASPSENQEQEREPFFYTVPHPPVPGATSWSIAPL